MVNSLHLTSASVFQHRGGFFICVAHTTKRGSKYGQYCCLRNFLPFAGNRRQILEKLTIAEKEQLFYNEAITD